MKLINKGEFREVTNSFRKSRVKMIAFTFVIIFLSLTLSFAVFVYTPLIRSLGIVGQNRLISPERAFENIISVDGKIGVNELILKYFIGKQDGEVVDYNRIVKAIMQVDSLNNEVELWRAYAHNITQIISGTKDPLRADSIIEKGRAVGNVAATRSALDSLLRSQVALQIEKLESDNEANSKYKIYPPVRGQISVQFDLKHRIYGITILTTKTAPVMSVGEGTVVSSIWSPREGYVIQIQHPDNFISVYKGVTNTLKEIGARVASREVIGYIGGVEVLEADTLINVLNPQNSTLYFELWQNGNRIDPEKYIIF